MASCTFFLCRHDSIDSCPRWLASFADCRDADAFARMYMESAKMDDCPAGYPVVKLFHRVSSKGVVLRNSLMKSYYPNAYDCSVVEVLEVGSDAV